MIEVLLASIISCQDAKKIAHNLIRIELAHNVKKDIMVELENASPDNCKLPSIE